MKNRLFGLLCFLASAGMLYYNWHTLINDGYYYVKLNFILPLLMLIGLFMIAAPSIPSARPVAPGTPAAPGRAILAIIVIFGGLGLGFALGFVNVEMMSNYAR